jgi:hypothetical protein
MQPSLSAYMQCHDNRTALWHTLDSFRRAYPNEAITLVSDQGEDFSRFASHFTLRYRYSPRRCDPRGGLGLEGATEYLRRIHDHCLAVTSDFVVILEEDVTTRRRVRTFPRADCAGPRSNGLSDALVAHLRELNGTTADYGYGMCGGSIFRRDIFLRCYESGTLDLAGLAELDPAAVQYSDVALTLLFLVNGATYEVWEEISEMYHPVPELRIFRDAAFDHNDKRWYGVPFDERLLL